MGGGEDGDYKEFFSWFRGISEKCFFYGEKCFFYHPCCIYCLMISYDIVATRD